MAQTPSSSILDAVPPSDKGAERAVLGSILIDHSRLAEVEAILKPEAFYVEDHRILYEHILSIGEIAIDATLLLDSLRTAGKLEAVGGPAYIAETLKPGAVTPLNAIRYATVIVEQWQKRKMIELNTLALTSLYDGRWKPKDLAKRQIEALLRML